MSKIRVNVWLDDVRKPDFESGLWIWAETVDDVKSLFEAYEVVEISLDHDLGNNQETGYDLVKWMVVERVWPQFKPWIHSWNPEGRKAMQQTINCYGPYDDDGNFTGKFTY